MISFIIIFSKTIKQNKFFKCFLKIYEIFSKLKKRGSSKSRFEKSSPEGTPKATPKFGRKKKEPTSAEVTVDPKTLGKKKAY